MDPKIWILARSLQGWVTHKSVGKLALLARFMGPTWGPTGPRWAPCWPHEPCYLGGHHWRNRRDVNWSFMTMTVTFGWPHWCGCLYMLLTGVSSDVGVPSTHLFFTRISCMVCSFACACSRVRVCVCLCMCVCIARCRIRLYWHLRLKFRFMSALCNG